MICAIVASAPPSAFEGRANSIGLPLRRRPRDSRRLFTYVDAVLRLNESIVWKSLACGGLFVSVYFWPVWFLVLLSATGVHLSLVCVVPVPQAV